MVSESDKARSCPADLIGGGLLDGFADICSVLVMENPPAESGGGSCQKRDRYMLILRC